MPHPSFTLTLPYSPPLETFSQPRRDGSLPTSRRLLEVSSIVPPIPRWLSFPSRTRDSSQLYPRCHLLARVWDSIFGSSFADVPPRPFLAGDYAIATRFALESATLFNFAPPPVTFPPSPAGENLNTFVSESPPPPRNMLLTVIGLAPHRFGMWTSSARPGESVMKYQLLNGCPALVLPVLPGSPLVSWVRGPT